MYEFEYLIVDDRNASYHNVDTEDSYDALYKRIFNRHGVEHVRTIMILNVIKAED